MSRTNTFFLCFNKFIINFICLNGLLLSQDFIEPNSLSIARNSLISEFSTFNSGAIKSYSGLNFSFNVESIFNNGHANIDNNAELYSPSKIFRMISSRFSYNNSWINLELEPYIISHDKIFNKEKIYGSFSYNNNHVTKISSSKNKLGLRQSRLVLHFNGIGLGYGLMSHWWSPGFHSSLALSSNAPSQKTYSLGTFKDIVIGNFTFGSNLIVKPYTNSVMDEIYFSGLKANLSYSSSSTIITIGLNRTYLSGNFKNLNLTTDLSKKWTLIDAAKLVIEPLFGQSKKNLNYTIIGTPGFDVWDELLTGFININFTDQNLNIYLDIASDDNRGNLSDLRAHWDHTLGYQLGIKKFLKFRKFSFFTGVEYLTTRVSNTFNPVFYRGDPNTINYYSKSIYDYFTYKGRRMGAHSGSSSDDFIVKFGLSNKNLISFFSFNRERHGIKSMINPEIKNEYSASFQRKLKNNVTLSLSFEYEHIRNFSFIENNISISRLFWLSYSYAI